MNFYKNTLSTICCNCESFKFDPTIIFNTWNSSPKWRKQKFHLLYCTCFTSDNLILWNKVICLIQTWILLLAHIAKRVWINKIRLVRIKSYFYLFIAFCFYYMMISNRIEPLFSYNNCYLTNLLNLDSIIEHFFLKQTHRNISHKINSY